MGAWIPARRARDPHPKGAGRGDAASVNDGRRGQGPQTLSNGHPRSSDELFGGGRHPPAAVMHDGRAPLMELASGYCSEMTTDVDAHRPRWRRIFGGFWAQLLLAFLVVGFVLTFVAKPYVVP